MLRLVGLTGLLLSLACANGVPMYNVAVKNATRQHLVDVHVSFGDFSSLTTQLHPDSHMRQGRVPHPIPDRATVTWRTPDGAVHKKEVAVKPAVPADFSGDIFFDIEDGDRVRTRAVPYK
jgi:hypothetical protein